MTTLASTQQHNVRHKPARNNTTSTLARTQQHKESIPVALCLLGSFLAFKYDSTMIQTLPSMKYRPTGHQTQDGPKQELDKMELKHD